jgi:ABC-type multidrug transport system fused ATPase/permease subunit
MATNFNIFVPAMLMFLFASGLGCLFLVIAWAKVFMQEEQNVRSTNITALYAFTASVAVEALGTGLVTAIPDQLKYSVWLFVFLIAFACVLASLLLLRRHRSGPERGAVKAGSIILFVIYALGFLSMIATLPGIQSH